MGQAFDPYHKWLGIPPEEQPANHYRLLGIREFEDDPDVVQSAADQRMAHLRTYQTGRYADWSQRLLNEVAAAKICLLNAAKKTAYDEHLRETKQSESPPAPPASDHPFDLVADEPRPRASSALLAKRRMPVTAIITCVVTLCVVLVAAWVYLSSEPPENGQVAPSQSPDKLVTTPTSTAPAAEEPKASSKSPALHAKTEPGRTSDRGEKAATTEMPPLEAPTFVPLDAASSREKATAKPKLALNADAEPGSMRPIEKPNEPEPATPVRVSTPAADEQDAAMKLARDLYRSDFTKAKTPDEKQAMAKRLLGQATAAAKADAGAFVLFRLARDISTQASDIDTALAAIDAMSERFQVDAWEMKLEAMQACSKKGRTPPQHIAVAEQAIRLADEAAAAGSYPQAVGLAKLAMNEAGTARNKELVLTTKASLADLQKKARLAAESETARTALATNPDDPAANLVVGIYYGCLQDDWPKALPHLAKGDDANLQKAAKQELDSPPVDGDAQAALGDVWWNAAQNADPAKRAALLRHAASWYTRAQANGLGGLAKVRIEKRLEELVKTDRETPAVRASARPSVPMGKWFSLLPSPNELTGWDVKGCQFNYANRIIELRSQSMYCPIIAKDATMRAKVRRHGGPRIRMILRESALGCYVAQLTGNDCQILKLTRNVQPGQQPSATTHGPGSENTLSRVPIPRTPNDVVFEMSFAAAGNTLTVFLNRQPVAQAKDAAFTEGMVGIGADNADGLFFTDVELLIPKGSLIVDHR